MSVVVAAALAGGLILAGHDRTDAAVPALPVLAIVIVIVGCVVVGVARYRAATVEIDAMSARLDEDPLTGLPNRTALPRLFDDLLRDARRMNGRFAILAIDLDGFERINVSHGIDAGDTVMRITAERLRSVVAERDVVVRVGGDGFVVLCTDVSSARAVERYAAKVIQAVREPVPVDEEVVRVSATVGIALSEERCTKPDEVLHDAAAASILARRSGSGRMALFDRAESDQVTPANAERRLRSALEQGEFRLYFQPVVSLWTKRLVGVEALLRWNDPRRGMVPPREFLPVLDDTGLIVPIGAWILDEVCQQSQRWRERFPDRPPLNVKVNVSGRQLLQADFIGGLRSALERAGADPSQLTLEVDESTLMADVGSSFSILKEAKALGVSLALDDFGTGHSSLAYLRSMGLDLLAIDRTFVEGITEAREDRVIVEHVIAMAKALGIVAVAEGVETEEQVELLRSLNCDLAQGYYFSHPQPPDVITELLAGNTSHLEWTPEARDGDAPVAPVRPQATPVPETTDRFSAR